MTYGSLAPTGVGLSLAGLAFGHLWLVVATLLVTLAGAGVVRLTFRRGKGPADA